MKEVTIDGKKYQVEDSAVKDVGKGVTLYKTDGSVLFKTDCKTVKEAVKKRGTNLCGADLLETDLLGADLRGADLRWAYLDGADLRKADLGNADLRWAYLSEAKINKDQTGDLLKAMGVIVED